MSRRILALVFSATALMSVVPALAQSHVIAEKTNHKGIAVYLGHSFLPHHRYRIQVTSPKHRQLTGLGTEEIFFMANKRFQTTNKSFTLHGKTPYSMVLNSPSVRGLTAWQVAVSVQILRGRGLTIRFVDLGRH